MGSQLKGNESHEAASSLLTENYGRLLKDKGRERSDPFFGSESTAVDTLPSNSHLYGTNHPQATLRRRLTQPTPTLDHDEKIRAFQIVANEARDLLGGVIGGDHDNDEAFHITLTSLLGKSLTKHLSSAGDSSSPRDGSAIIAPSAQILLTPSQPPGNASVHTYPVQSPEESAANRSSDEQSTHAEQHKTLYAIVTAMASHLLHTKDGAEAKKDDVEAGYLRTNANALGHPEPARVIEQPHSNANLGTSYMYPSGQGDAVAATAPVSHHEMFVYFTHTKRIQRPQLAQQPHTSTGYYSNVHLDGGRGFQSNKPRRYRTLQPQTHASDPSTSGVPKAMSFNGFSNVGNSFVQHPGYTSGVPPSASPAAQNGTFPIGRTHVTVSLSILRLTYYL